VDETIKRGGGSDNRVTQCTDNTSKDVRLGNSRDVE
jgi:hypothetical protein